MKKSGRRNKPLVTQYREIFPGDWSRHTYPEFENLMQPQQSSIVSQNFTTYSAGETPIPTPVPQRRA